MALFAISFRIHKDNGYDTRYDSVVEAIKELAESGKYWDETTSFFLIESSTTASNLAAQIEENSVLSVSRDMLLVINLSQKGYKVIGNYQDLDLDWLMQRR
jgi:hypothetical protein